MQWYADDFGNAIPRITTFFDDKLNHEMFGPIFSSVHTYVCVCVCVWSWVGRKAPEQRRSCCLVVKVWLRLVPG